MNFIGDLVGHGALQAEDVAHLFFVAFGPKMGLRFGIDQLHSDADALGLATHAALDDVIHREVAADLVYGLVFVALGGVAGDDRHLPGIKFGQLRAQFFGHALAEIILRGVTAEIVQGQHHQAHQSGGGFRRNQAVAGQPE